MKDSPGKGVRRHRPVYQSQPVPETKKQVVVSFCTLPGERIAFSETRGDTTGMRALAGVVVAAALLFGVYEYYLKQMPTSDPGTAPTQAISLTGVRNDLLQIAQAERGWVAMNGKCASMDELTSSQALAMSRPDRDGYSYSIACSGADFSVTARHPAAPAGSPIRYPTLAVDANMHIQDVN